MRVTGVFTGTTSSPSPWLRQRPSRYTIRAGRNLPDKEFRYLRTVIVTAAVYRGFGRKLFPTCVGMTSFLNLPAPGRCHTLYVHLTCSQSDVFLLNSRLAQFTAIPPSLSRNGTHRARHPFFRSYGVNLPRSLTTAHSST